MEYLNNVLPFIYAEADTTAEETKVAEQKPQLTDDEKKKFNEVFRERYAELQEKSRKDAAKAIEEATKKLKDEFAAELEKAKAPKKSKEGEGEDDQTAEAKRIVADYKKSLADRDEKITNLTTQLAGKDKDIYGMRKDAAISEAMSGIPFVNPKQVKVLTGDSIETDPDSGKFVIRNEDGDIVQGDDFKPLSLRAYFAKYAEENPHLVKSDVKGGSGSTPNAAQGKSGKFSNIKSKADLSKNMALRIAFVNEKGLDAFKALPAN